MTAKRPVIAYWLIPEQVAREFFANAIRKLGSQFSAPIFDPHLTVFLAPENSRNPTEVLRELPPIDIELRVRGVRSGESFTKTVFVQFAKNDPLQELVNRTGRLSDASARCHIDPHLSLLYASLPSATKRELAASIQLPFTEVRFCGIQAVHCISPTENSDEVGAWQFLAER